MSVVLKRGPRLPLDSTRQGEGILYGHLSRTINRWAGVVIVTFLVIHVVGLAIVHVGLLSGILSWMPWLANVQYQTWFHAIYFVLFPAVAFHFLYTLKLVAMDVGLRVDYRKSFWVIAALSVAAGLWGAFGYGS